MYCGELGVMLQVTRKDALHLNNIHSNMINNILHASLHMGRYWEEC